MKIYHFNMSKLYFKYGAMNSGKSMFLLAIANNFDERGVSFISIKPSIDNRDGCDAISSRALPKRPCVSVLPTTNIYNSVEKLLTVISSIDNDKIKWILVDEAQFLTEEQVNQLSDIVDEFNINVMCFGLRTDFQSKLFPGSKRLFELSDTIEEIKSTCSCGKKNIINARVDENKQVIIDGEQVQIGGNESYMSMCRECYKKEIKNLKLN